MDLKVNQNHKGYKDLLKYSQGKNMTVREVMMSDDHVDAVCDILYKHMSTMIRYLVKKDKFKNLYIAQRESLVDIFDNMPKEEAKKKK